MGIRIVDSAVAGTRVPLTLPTIEKLLQPMVRAKLMSNHAVQDIWKRLNPTYNKLSEDSPTSDSTVFKSQCEIKLGILRQIEKVIVEYFCARGRIDNNFLMSRYSNQYLKVTTHIDLLIHESDMFDDFGNGQHHNGTITTDEIKILFIHYYLFCQYVSKIRSRVSSLPPRDEAMYLKVVTSETHRFEHSVYASKQSIKHSVDDFVSFGMVLHMYPQFSMFSSSSKASNICTYRNWSSVVEKRTRNQNGCNFS